MISWYPPWIPKGQIPDWRTPPDHSISPRITYKDSSCTSNKPATMTVRWNIDKGGSSLGLPHCQYICWLHTPDGRRWRRAGEGGAHEEAVHRATVARPILITANHAVESGPQTWVPILQLRREKRSWSREVGWVGAEWERSESWRGWVQAKDINYATLEIGLQRIKQWQVVERGWGMWVFYKTGLGTKGVSCGTGNGIDAVSYWELMSLKLWTFNDAVRTLPF